MLYFLQQWCPEEDQFGELWGFDKAYLLRFIFCPRSTVEINSLQIRNDKSLIYELILQPIAIGVSTDLTLLISKSLSSITKFIPTYPTENKTNRLIGWFPAAEKKTNIKQSLKISLGLEKM